ASMTDPDSRSLLRHVRLTRREFVGAAAGAVAAATALGAAPRAAAARPPKRGGVIKHIGVDPLSFDIHDTASDQTAIVSSFVRRTLFKFVQGAGHGPSDFTLAPDLALRAAASKDGRVYTIRLRPGVLWENRPPLNGRELVAADVKYSLERALRRSSYANLLGRIEAGGATDAHPVP